MSTRISTAHSNLLTRLDALFSSSSDWQRIPNPYDVPANSETFLRKGYGVQINEGANSHRVLSSQLSIDRVFGIVLSREVFKTDGDADGYAQVALDLYEDLQTVIKDFEKNTTLNTGQTFFEYVSDEGVRPIRGEDFSILYLVSRFKTIIFEDLNS